MHPNLSATLLWTNQGTVGTTLTSDDHSDAIDLRQVNAVWLAVAVGAILTGDRGDSPIDPRKLPPELLVRFEVQDSGGTWFHVLTVHPYPAYDPPIMAHGSAGLFLPAGPDSSGRRDSDFAPMVLPEYGRVSWSVLGTSPVFRSTVISLYGR